MTGNNISRFKLGKGNSISIEELRAQLATAEKEKTALLKVISHDLRSPMNKLFALIGLFKMSGDTLTEEQTSYLDKMELVISDGLSQMHNLMDLRAIEGDGLDTLFEPINLGKLISRVIREYIPSAHRKNIKLNFENMSISLETDRLSCLRILDQLLSNAIKFSPTGGVVSIEVEDKDEEVLIHIIDGGYGIVDDEQSDLYKKFMVLSSPASGGESLTGIGLYIAQWMANNIGGSIEYQNAGKSVFTLRLPKVRMA